MINVLQEHHASGWGACAYTRDATSSDALTATRDSLIAANIFGCPSQRPFPQLLKYTCLSLVFALSGNRCFSINKYNAARQEGGAGVYENRWSTVEQFINNN